MKKIILPLIIAFAGLTQTLKAQTIPNAGFEAWTIDSTGSENPDGWMAYTNIGMLSIATVTKSTDKQAGTYSAKLTPMNLGGTPLPAIVETQILTKTSSKYLNFYAKSNLQSTDSLMVFISSNDTVGVGGAASMTSISSATWAPFYIDLTTMVGSNFDTLMFGMYLTGGNTSTANFDNFSFSSTSVGTPFGTPLTNGIKDILNAGNGQLSAAVYPNPAQATTNIDFNVIRASNVTIKVIDLSGKEVKTLVNNKRMMGKQSITCDVNDLNNGIYFVSIIAGDQSTTKKLVINK